MTEVITNRLVELKTKLHKNDMSLLAGAGLSRSASSLFPLWEELLWELCVELFEPEIKTKFQALKGQKKGKTISYDDFLKEQVKEYITQIGYLKLVSDYIKRKGYREAIDSSIEQRTPVLTNVGGTYYLTCTIKGEKHTEILNDEMLSLHHKLIDLPWNNIYTTNYDQLIETCVDRSVKENIVKKKAQLERRLQEQDGFMDKARAEIMDIDKMIDLEEQVIKMAEIQRKSTGSMFTGPDAIEKPDSQNETINNLKLKKGGLQNSILRTEYLNRDIKKRIQQLTELLDECLNVVVHSSQLELKKNKNIIKLHGSLRTKTNDRYSFDNDPHVHYIISEEDYTTYPQKHEAFTQLMRITLLRESFCLIGFSGVDPNFLAWIGWVRDIVQRDPKRTADKHDKIYLIETSDRLPEPDKALFFQNHSIVPIPLLHPDCITFLETETGLQIADKSSRKEVLLRLMDFLGDGSYLNKPKAALELLEIEDYNETWNGLQINPPSFEAETLIQSVPLLTKLKSFIPIPNLHFSYAQNKDALLFFITPIVNTAKDQKGKKALLELLLIAVRDQLVPYSVYNEVNGLDELVNTIGANDQQPSLRLLKLKDAAWRGDEKAFFTIQRHLKRLSPAHSDEFTFAKALQAAYTFDFKKLKRVLALWRASGHWILKKAGLLALIDLNNAIKLLESAEFDLFQDQLSACSLLDYFLKARRWGPNKKLEAKADVLKREGFQPIEDQVDSLIKSVNKSKSEIDPYGKNKFTIQRSYSFDRSTKALESIQFFGLLEASGFPLALPRINFRNHEKTYKLFKHCLNYYPYPALFYSFQYGENKIIKRIAQDYIYIEGLEEQYSALSQRLQNAYLSPDTPVVFKSAILQFYAELITVLSPSAWESFFKNVWQTLLREKQLFVELQVRQNDFIIQGLSLIRNPQLIRIVIIDCLDNIELQNGDTSITFLYQLAHNYWAKKATDAIKSENLDDTLFKIIRSVQKHGAKAIFCLGNLEPYLSHTHKQALQKELYNFDYRSINNVRVWHPLLFFVSTNKDIVSRMKKAILASKALWANGISDKGRKFPLEFISLSQLSNRKNNQHINWDKSEKQLIYNGLLLCLNQIENAIKTQPDSDFEGYESLLEEMKDFLELQMEGTTEVRGVQERVQKLYAQQKGYSDLVTGISSMNKNVVIWAIIELFDQMYRINNFNGNERYLSILLDKVLLRSEPALEASLHYLTIWLKHLSHKETINNIKPLVLQIVESYWQQPPDYFEKPFLEEKLIKLATVLKRWQVHHPTINEIIIYSKKPKFYSILYKLRYLDAIQ